MANLMSFPTPLMLLMLLTVLLQKVSAQQKTEKQGVVPIMLGLGPDPCGQQCDFVYNPVCGSDGSTYPNSCFLSQAACRSPGIVPLSYRPCATPDPCNFVCDRMLDPVCGTDGRTYTNPCVLMYYSCYYSGSGLVRRHFGRCAVNRVCPTSCPRNKQPVCGSDGRTYANPCSLLLQVCGGRNVFKVRDGACNACPRPCTRIYLPVCGSDGVTYPSQCVMESRVCDGLPAVTRAYEGPCST